MAKIYDCIPFFNELDLLELRLEILYKHVDKFIISECDFTFSGEPKIFYLEENKERFSKYWDKIIHLKHYGADNFTDPPNVYEGKKSMIFEKIKDRLRNISTSEKTNYGQPHWCRDFLHKELMMIHMDNIEDDDLIMFGDCDEIPNPARINFNGNTYLFNQKNMMYGFNVENSTEKWHGTYITKYKNLLDDSCMFTRDRRFEFEVIEDCGWHFSWFGGKDKMIEKLKSWSHQEFNNTSYHENINNLSSVENDILNRNIVLKKIDCKEYYPDYVYDIIQDKYKHLIV